MDLYTQQIQDDYTRENFERVQEAFNDLVFTLGDFKFFEIDIKGSRNGYKFYHHLGFHPNDVIVSRALGAKFEFNYVDFTNDYISINTAGDLHLRCFIGNMRGSQKVGLDARSNLSSSGTQGTLEFNSRETEIDGNILTSRQIILPDVPKAGSETVFYNGLPMVKAGFSITQNILTFSPDVELFIGDTVIVTFSV